MRRSRWLSRFLWEARPAGQLLASHRSVRCVAFGVAKTSRLQGKKKKNPQQKTKQAEKTSWAVKAAGVFPTQFRNPWHSLLGLSQLCAHCYDVNTNYRFPCFAPIPDTAPFCRKALLALFPSCHLQPTQPNSEVCCPVEHLQNSTAGCNTASTTCREAGACQAIWQSKEEPKRNLKE